MKELDYIEIAKWINRVVESSTTKAHLKSCERLLDRYQDLIINQTNLDLVTTDGQLIYEGEITEYSVTPMSATAQNTAAQNRLKMTVALRYINTKREEDDFNKNYSFFYDFPAELQVYDIKDAAHKEIFDRITQDIFNDTLAKW